MEPEEILW